MAKVIDSAKAAVTWNGKQWALPMDFAGIGIIYNKDIFAQYNLKPPTTYRELERVVKTLKDNGVTPFAGPPEGELVHRPLHHARADEPPGGEGHPGGEVHRRHGRGKDQLRRGGHQEAVLHHRLLPRQHGRQRGGDELGPAAGGIRRRQVRNDGPGTLVLRGGHRDEPQAGLRVHSLPRVQRREDEQVLRGRGLHLRHLLPGLRGEAGRGEEVPRVARHPRRRSRSGPGSASSPRHSRVPTCRPSRLPSAS